MMSDFTSKLTQRAQSPLRGMGSALPANQRLTGSQDPEQDARLASMSPEQVRETLEADQARLDEAARKWNDLRAAASDGSWLPEGATADVVESCRDPETISAWHVEYIAWRTSQEEETSEDRAERGLLGGDPGNPLYDAVMDSVRRKAMAEKVKEINFTDLILRGSAEQVIPIRRGLDVTFRTLSTQQSLWLELRLDDVRGSGSAYGAHWVGLLYVAASLTQINDVDFNVPDLTKLNDISQKAEFDKEVNARMKRLGAMPSDLTNELITQYQWFAGRVRALLQGDLMGMVGN